MTQDDIKKIISGWEQFKKDNQWKSDAINVEKILIDRFAKENGISNHCTCWKCMGLDKDPYEDDDIEPTQMAKPPYCDIHNEEMTFDTNVKEFFCWTCEYGDNKLK